MPTLDSITSAIAQIQQEGGTVSIEAVRAITGGSPRDIGLMLKQLRGETAPAPAPAVIRPLDRPQPSRLTWAEVHQAAQAIRQARQANIFTRAELDVTPERLVAYFDAQQRFRPAIFQWEVWAALRPAVADPNELQVLDWYINALRCQQAVFSDTKEMRVLRTLFKRLFNA